MACKEVGYMTPDLLTREEHDRCKKCGKCVTNRWSLCARCRKTECKKCGRTFMPKVQLSEVCHPCRAKRNDLAAGMGEGA